MPPTFRIGWVFLIGALVARPQDGSLRKNPYDTQEDAERGARVFQTYCSYCHGTRGEGGRGADLTTGRYNNGGSDPELFNTIKNGIRGSEMPPVRASDEDVWRMVAFVKRIGSAGTDEKAPGDAQAGKSVYQAKGCATCHAIGSTGGNLGPDLTDIGRVRGLKYLEESIVKPEADIPVPYRGLRIITKGGQSVTGIRLNEDDLSIQLRDTGDNLRSFLKKDINEIRSDRPSLMPSYASVLSRKELEDLVAYLNLLRGPM